QAVKGLQGEWGHISGEKHNDVGNVANTTLFDVVSPERALETLVYYNFQTCPIGTPIPSCGLNSQNIIEASGMLVIPPIAVDDHWDGSFDDIYPVYETELFPPGKGLVESGRYTIKVASEGELEEGVPKYDWKVDLDSVGVPNYIYPQDGAEKRPDGTSGGDKNNYLTGPSIAVVATKEEDKINGLRGLGIGNEYSMSAIARSQVYYLRNPKRPDEKPSLFNPHWVARLAPIESEDTPIMLREGLPYVASIGIPIKPTH
ncbi:MAG: hypothetical protein KBC84_02610, partial [Proteobacteria bacterium]|nr:hypothetical protein [Pseudomonadota bacterium]